MQKQLYFRLQWLLAVLAAVLAALCLTTRAHAAGPASASCTLVGTTRTCELWAKTGTATIAGNPINIWGYTDSAGGMAQLPGPFLVANQGETVVVILHNDLNEASSLALHGQGLLADTAGAPAGGTTTYTFVAVNAGTFLYEAGLTANGAKQVAMGLYGALVIQPTTPDPAYTNEIVLVLSEIDPALNANPGAFDMLAYSPKYWLINGEAHPDTDAIQASAGQTLRVRYVNAGLTDHSPALLGLDQTVFAKDGYTRPAFRAVAETVAAGQTMDVLIAVPATLGARYPLSDGNLHVDNNGLANGGMMTFIEAVTPPTPAVANTPPVPSISAPADASAFTAGTVITFTGAATDAEDGDVTTSVTWASDIDGPLGTGGTFSTSTLSEGLHTITATATDSGSLTGSVTITVTINANTAPTAAISAPADASTFAAGAEVTFTGTGADVEDGDVTASMAWSSDVDGPLGAGGTLATSTLSVGTHVITATVTDSGSQTGTASITVTISP